MKQILTDGGTSLILRGLTGSKIEFTKIKFGNGEEQDKTAVDLNNPLLECPITSIARDTNFITLGTSYKNADVQEEFSAFETGVFAKDPDDDTQEILYCLWYEGDPVKADYLSPVDDKILETKIEFLVFVANVENVTAIISASMEYAPKTALEDHVNNDKNPHKVDAEDVGLGNVPNVTPENQKPVFSETITSVTTGEDGTKSLPNIQNGDVMGVILQKIRSAISAFVSHLNAKNPHGLKARDIGAAESTHYHSASNINKGTLGLVRGGTGGATADEARTNIGAAPIKHNHAVDDITGCVSLEDVANLYVWSEYSRDPTTNYDLESYRNVYIATDEENDGVYSDITYASSVAIDVGSGSVSLVEPSTLSGVTTGRDNSLATTLAGKFVESIDGDVYYVSENATIAYFANIVSGNGSFEGSRMEYSSGRRVCPIDRERYVAAKAKGCYPTSGELNGYWYVYRKQLGD